MTIICNEIKNKKYKGADIIKNSVCIIVAGILWGIISLFVRVLQEIGFNSMEIVCIRVTISAILMVLLILVKDKSKLKIKIKDIPLFIGTGVCSIVFFNLCYFEAINVIGGSSLPALLLYTAPIFVMIISLFLFKEKITKKKIISLIMTFVGLMLVTGVLSSSDNISYKAVLLGLGAGLGYALYSIFGKYLVDKYDSLTITAYTFIIASVFAIPISKITNNISLMFSFKAIISGIALALICTVLPFLLYTIGLKKTEAGKAAVFATIEPFVAAIVGLLFFNESLTIEKIVGMLLILSAIIILNLNKKNI